MHPSVIEEQKDDVTRFDRLEGGFRAQWLSRNTGSRSETAEIGRAVEKMSSDDPPEPTRITCGL